MKGFLPMLLALIIQCQANDTEENKKNGNQWALLVSGSSGWVNYRHQADLAHSYHILIKRGFPASKIIVMMEDDVARSSMNPYPGKLFNKPNGPDVYKGLKIDYKGSNVTPKVFLDVLSGNKKAVKGKGTGRVIESGRYDNVFVNFVDHGGPGILCFPNDSLSAKDLLKTLEKLTKSKKYSKLLLYIEACESGSIFDNLLPQNTSILASTAAAYDEPSWGCYCGFENFPCLGDLYSVNWMEHLDKKVSAKENLFDQYQKVRTLTSKSHVNLYGDYRVGPSLTADFVGRRNLDNEKEDFTSKHYNKYTTVPSRDVGLYWLKQMAKKRQYRADDKYTQMVTEVEKNREFIDKTVDSIIEKVADGDHSLQYNIKKMYRKFTTNMLDCYEDIYKLFSEKCFNLNKNPYVLKHFHKFANICHMGGVFKERAVLAIKNLCHSKFLLIDRTI